MNDFRNQSPWGSPPGGGGGNGGSDGGDDAEERLNSNQKMIQARSKLAGQKITAGMKKKQAELNNLMRTVWLEEAMKELASQGQTGLMANWTAMKMTMGRMQRELALERNRLNQLHGKVFDSKAAAMSELEEAMSGLGGGGAAVLLGSSFATVASGGGALQGCRPVLQVLRAPCEAEGAAPRPEGSILFSSAWADADIAAYALVRVRVRVRVRVSGAS